jgi:catechol 2,3-dioxygenase-like lactoylglutathione lyase family enzyme
MIHGINHIAISTPSLERLAAFYCEQLGFKQVFPVNWDIGNAAYDNLVGLRNSSARGLVLRLGNACIELFEYKTPTPLPAPELRPESDHGITHVCLQVTDIDTEYARLRAAGMHFQLPTSNRWGWDLVCPR